MMKKIVYSFLMFLSIFLLTGCKKDSMENIEVYTTIYPIEYITNELYGDYSDVYSIYPNEIITLSDKLIKDYSNSNLFIYNGLSDEKNYAVKMLNNNRNLKIIDATMGMQTEDNVEELWINPSYFLMLCQNIKNSMKEYINNAYLKKNIDSNYEELYLKISELDAEIKLLAENADDNNILVSNNALKFLTKYDLNVLSLDESDEINDKTKATIKNEIDKKNIKYIIMLKGDILSDDVSKFVNDNGIEKIYFDSLNILSEKNKNDGKDYISIMYENLDILKKELYSEK